MKVVIDKGWPQAIPIAYKCSERLHREKRCCMLAEINPYVKKMSIQLNSRQISQECPWSMFLHMDFTSLA